MSPLPSTSTRSGMGVQSNKGRVLLHCCCGPCSIYPVRTLLAVGYSVSCVFVNPNIQPLAEYLRRREAMQQCAAKLGVEVLWRDDLWDMAAWLQHVATHDDTAPGRCLYCYRSRLKITADMARGYDFFTTSLLYSKYQRHDDICRIAEDEAARVGVPFLYHDFREGWREGINISKEFDVYRQPYCGCVYSEVQRYEKKLKKLCENA